MKKHFLLLILAALLPVVAWADESGKCGSNLTWTYYESTHSLVLTGSGDMYDYSWSNTPWYNYRNDIVSMTLPDGLTSIGNTAFYLCSSLISASIPNSVTSIGYDAFSCCSNLTSVNIPYGVTSINTYTFYGCSSLTSVNIPNGVTSIGGSAFKDCNSLSSVTIPNSVTSIGNGAFFGCSSLTSVIIPNSMTSIDDYAFEGCSSLTSLTIPNSVTSIGNGAFSGCRGLTDISIGNNITTINNRTFSGCTSLKTLTLGGRITQIKENNFTSCKELTTVYCYADNPPSLGNDVFSESYIEYATLYVPTQSIDNYRKYSKWGSFKYVFPIENIYGEKCAKPTISYSNGKLTFKSTTDDARFVTTIKNDDIKSYEGNEVYLSLTYTIEVCAKSFGYLDSDVAIATLCWMDKEPTTEGITNNVANLSAQTVLIQSEGGMMTVQGLDDGQQVSVYGIDGTQAGAAVSSNGQAVVGTNLKAGSVAIIKIGDRSVKVAIK